MAGRGALRTTGAGFCYDIGRVASAAGTVAFGALSAVHDDRTALIAAGWLFLPAGRLALGLPDLVDREGAVESHVGTLGPRAAR